ncbi:unnamed protein product [Linum tenue]|uniref:Uncharacterized protein n=1 Tax=Linum tenue TaxID=586396 RepID=A0AAV0HWG6_9ROSI|nr:unnamed protein product [Linum tenue]
MVLGLISCSLLPFVNNFFDYWSNQLYVSSVVAQIVVRQLWNPRSLPPLGESTMLPLCCSFK